MSADSSISELFALIREMGKDLAAQTAILGRVEKELDDKEKRIKTLELESAKQKGIMAVVGILGSIIGSVAVWLVRHFSGNN